MNLSKPLNGFLFSLLVSVTPPPAIAAEIKSSSKDDRGVIVYAEDEPNLAPAKGHTLLERGTPISDASGKTLYVIHLRENVVKNARKSVEHLVAPRRADAKENSKNFRGWHRNEMQHLTDILEKEYSFNAVAMTSWVGSSIVSFLDTATAEKLALDDRVFQVEQVDSEVRVKFSSIWNDRFDGGELVTWGKQSIGTDDTLSTNNYMYLIDSTPFANPDIAMNVAPVNSPGLFNAREHGTFVAGILIGKSNGQFSRGVNPSAPNAWSVEIGSGLAYEFRNSVDWILAHSEQNGVYGSANISFNLENNFRFDQEYGKLVRRLSARSFVAQSAGNHKLSACLYAYCSPQLHGYYDEPTHNKVDGIVVVGGINSNNEQDIPYDNNNLIPSGFTSNPFFPVFEAGSNAGHCVEMWAPSSTHSTMNFVMGGTSNTPLMIAGKGTSFAAPHIVGLAARYGGASTTPVQREAYLRSKLLHTGNRDNFFEAIYRPSALNPSLFSIPSRLMPTAIQASSSTASSDLWSTQDSLYLSGNFWNAGSATGWIQFDLGQVRTLSSIRLVPEQSAFGKAKHEIFVSDGFSDFVSVKYVNEYTETMAPVSFAFNNVSAKIVRVKSNLTGLSWVSWREVEIYGY
jgi:hypothetical protein